MLVLGAAGGVGVAAVQISKVLGAKVVAVARGDSKAKLLKNLGADAVIDTSADHQVRHVAGSFSVLQLGMNAILTVISPCHQAHLKVLSSRHHIVAMSGTADQSCWLAEACKLHVPLKLFPVLPLPPCHIWKDHHCQQSSSPCHPAPVRCCCACSLLKGRQQHNYALACSYLAIQQ